MNHFVFNRQRFNKLYNCSYDVDMIPPESRKDLAYGVLHISFFILLEIMYVPCLWVIFWTESMRNNSCYRLMLMLGVYETSGMIISGLAVGYFYCVGAVFCTHPISMILSGSFGLALWYAEMQLSVLLAINRCAIIYSPSLANTLFNGRRTDVWIVFITVVACTLTYIGPFYTFSSAQHGWYFNPHVGYLTSRDPFVSDFLKVITENSDEQVQAFASFDNIAHRIFNFTTGATLIFTYMVFGAAVSLRLTLGESSVIFRRALPTVRPSVDHRHYRDETTSNKPQQHHDVGKTTVLNTATANTYRRDFSQAAETRTFIQIFVISVLCAIVSVGFALQGMYTLWPLLSFFIELSLMLFQGSPPVLYLCLNRTIRREVLALFTLKRRAMNSTTNSTNS